MSFNRDYREYREYPSKMDNYVQLLSSFIQTKSYVSMCLIKKAFSN